MASAARWLALVAAVALAGCSSSRSSVSVPRATTTTVGSGSIASACAPPAGLDDSDAAVSVVNRYYQYLTSQQFSGARSCLAPGVQPDQNLQGVANFRVLSAAPTASGMTVTVSYSATYAHVQGRTDGPVIDFLHLSRHGSAGTWLIDSIGSGP